MSRNNPETTKVQACHETEITGAKLVADQEKRPCSKSDTLKLTGQAKRFRKKIIWSDKTNIELFGHTDKNYVLKKTR